MSRYNSRVTHYLNNMDYTRLLLLAAGTAAVFIAAVYYFRNRKSNFLAVESIPTSPEVVWIEGQPDKHVVRLPDGGEVIRDHDIAMNPAIGVGEGTFGFGRFGSSFMA